MNQPNSNPPTTLDGPPSSQPVVRWRRRLAALGTLALAAGYYTGQFARKLSMRGG